MRLRDKVAFITGGTSGIGLATAEAFLREGARVVVTGRDAGRLEQALQHLGGATGYRADAASEEDMIAALQSTATAFGGIDILFANAGHYIHTELGSTSRAAFAAVLETNLTGVFFTVQAALPFLRDRASIIVTGSVYGTMGPVGASAYAASKGAVLAMARTMASELSPRGIRVNVVVPGAIDTPSWRMSDDQALRAAQMQRLGERAPLNRMLTAEEVANAVLFLASDESSGIQAAEIVVDGGTTGAMAGSPRFIRGE